ncbi:sugar transferase [Priestia megaterium]|jgi:lipopolysaccharide/colanic/teichoic acid biosynthesis glycosyltransferase|uniref:Sugar transferase n=1 Tax=Priestia megaterium TaxID=1404 RepID=A0A6H1PA92_PRIMG|nr:sugar transferase [Priestia megaterium]QIZ10385.1 sugar transferase [Priestia megaterium]
MKRLFDIFAGLLLLCLFSPIMLGVAIVVRVKLGSPILFKQKRVGYHEQIFTLFKFRTMTNEKDETGNDLPDSIRLTKVGLMIRRLSLDELPQLLNVVKGDMSLVGPRPLLVRYLPYYSLEERKRHSVRPGITGYAQVEGRNQLDWNSRLGLDVKYVENLSFGLDLRIIFKTISKTLKRDGIANVPDQQMLDFDVERRMKA